MSVVSNKILDVIVDKENKTFRMSETSFKRESAANVLENIAYIMEHNLTYKAIEHKHYHDLKAALTRNEMMTLLKKTARHITTQYEEETAKYGWLEKKFNGIKSEQEKIDSLSERIQKRVAIPTLLPKEITRSILSYLPVSDMAKFEQVNHETAQRTSVAYLDRARVFGYEGSDEKAAKVYLKELFNEIHLLCEVEKLIPEKYIAYNYNSENKKPILDPEKTLNNLASLTTPELFSMLADSTCKLLKFDGGYSSESWFMSSGSNIKFFKCLHKITSKTDCPQDIKILGSCALSLSIAFNNINIFNLLWKHNVEINLTDPSFEKNTALHFVFGGGSGNFMFWIDKGQKVEIIKRLLEHGVDVNARNGEGQTALTLARILNGREGLRKEIIKLLLQHGATE